MTLVLTATFGTATAAGSAAQLPSEQPTVSVRDFGAVGDGRTNDTAAIQRANDSVAARGGGSVFFPPGEYIAMAVQQDSGVEFTGSRDAILKHPDGVTNEPIVEGRVSQTTGSTRKGSSTVQVTSARRALVGGIVGIRGAGGGQPDQSTTLAAPISEASTSLYVSKPQGWSSVNVNHVLVGDEIIAYRGFYKGKMMNLARGLFGTRAVAHSAGAPVAQLKGLYARVQSVGRATIELDRPAVKTVTGVKVYFGSMDMTVAGLTLDGNRTAAGSAANPLPLSYDFARRVEIRDCVIRKGDHGAISLDMGTSESLVTNNTLMDHGTLTDTIGSALWLFRGVRDNEVRDNTIGGQTYKGVMVDDRSEKSTEWDEPSVGNSVIGNRIDIPAFRPNGAISVIGSTDTVVARNDVRGAHNGILVIRSSQGPKPLDAYSNLVVNNVLSNHQTGLYVTGSRNRFMGNVISMAVRPIWDAGTGNTYADVCTDDPMCSTDPAR